MPTWLPLCLHISANSAVKYCSENVFSCREIMLLRNDQNYYRAGKKRQYFHYSSILSFKLENNSMKLLYLSLNKVKKNNFLQIANILGKIKAILKSFSKHSCFKEN